MTTITKETDGMEPPKMLDTYTDPTPFEIILALTKDRATAATPEAALIAADTLVQDHVAVNPAATPRNTREHVYITENGTYNGVLTSFARGGRRTLVDTIPGLGRGRHV